MSSESEELTAVVATPSPPPNTRGSGSGSLSGAPKPPRPPGGYPSGSLSRSGGADGRRMEMIELLCETGVMRTMDSRSSDINHCHVSHC